jgi:Ca-activated chloride channel family protein
MPQFQFIEFLLLLLAVPVVVGLFYFSLKKKKSVQKKMGDPELVQQLTAGHSARAYKVKFLLCLFGLITLVLALANLRMQVGQQKISRNGIDLMIALDVSKSMLAQDVKPSRLDRAKQLLNRLVDKLGNNRVGIVIFAGKAYLQMPLTADHSAAKMYLSAATTESVPTQGTVIGDALKVCYASFNAKEKKYKAVVLISDGEDHDEAAEKVAQQMASSGVIIHTIGIGSPRGAPLMDESINQYKKDAEGNTVISRLNEKELKMIAQKGNGQYQLFQNTENAVSTIVAQLNNMEQRTVTDNSLVNYKSYFQFFLGGAFLLLLIEFFIAERKKSKKKNPELKPALVTLITLFSTLASFAQEDENPIIKKGNREYNNKQYANAEASYKEAVKKNPKNATAHFNLGNALYKSDKKEDAISAYEEAVEGLENPVEKSNAHYNKGVVLQNDKKLPECIEAYKNALKLDPANEDARQNLQKALQQLKKEKEKQDQKNKKDQQKEQQKPRDKPKPQQSKITKQDAENKLKALMQKEKELQDKLHKVNPASVNKPEKDW